MKTNNVKRACKRLGRMMRTKKGLPRVKDQYTITEIFPSKVMMENTLRNALK